MNVDATTITALGAAAAAVLTAAGALLNGWRGKRREVDETDEQRLRHYDEWSPKVYRWMAHVQRKWAELGLTEKEKLPDFPHLPEVHEREHERRGGRK